MDIHYNDLAELLMQNNIISDNFEDVDLTKKKILSKGKEMSSILIKRLEDVYVDHYSQTGIIDTGDIKTIESKKFYNTFCDGLTCDRCGRKIYAWEQDTICQNCNIQMDKSESLLFAISRKK